MNRIKLWSILVLASLVFPLMVSCGDDDKSESPTYTDGALISKAIGSWMCTSSTDSQQGQTYTGLMVGKEVTINANGTYTSTAPTFGYAGTYSVSGNVITAKSNSGATFVITVSISGSTMTWEGTAINGVTFKYTFKRESQNTPTASNFTQEMIVGDFAWNVGSVTFKRGSNSLIKKDHTIRFYADGKCEGFHAMETAWRITAGRLETYYDKTNEPIYTYTLLSSTTDGESLTVRIEGTLDNSFQATAVLNKTLSVEPEQPTTEESLWNSKEGIYAIRDNCYLYCSEFAGEQYELEKIRLNENTVHNITPITNCVQNAWQSAYRVLANTNLVLDNADEIGNVLSNSETKELLAEVRAIRAFVHYNLTMLYGDVPLVTKVLTADDSYTIVQSRQTDVIAFAYSEISAVIGNLKQSSPAVSKFFFTSDVGNMLKAEIELTLGNHAQANNTLNQIDGSRYVVTRSLYSGTPATSIIWGLHQTGADAFYCIYDYKHLYLFSKEASQSETAAELAQEWQNNNMKYEYGYWAALKRLKIAQTITGCYEFELLMPIPSYVIQVTPNIKQNVGY